MSCGKLLVRRGEESFWGRRHDLSPKSEGSFFFVGRQGRRAFCGVLPLQKKERFPSFTNKFVSFYQNLAYLLHSL